MGSLTFGEIKNCLIKLNFDKNINNEEIKSLFKWIDTNKSRRVEYIEFISSTIEKKEFLKKEKTIRFI